MAGPALSESLVVAPSTEGMVYFIPINSSGWENDLQIWVYTPRDTSLRNCGFYSSPAISNGRIYWGGSDGILYGLGTGSEVQLPDPTVKNSTSPANKNTWKLNIYPNPSRTKTNISFTLDKKQHVQIAVYNINGELVHKFFDKTIPQGNYEINWGAYKANNRLLPSGAYIFRVKTESGIYSKTVQIVR